MGRKKRQHRQRFSKRDWARRDYQPLWDDIDGPGEDLDDEWEDDESWQEPEGFWEDSGDDWGSVEDEPVRPRRREDWH